MKHLILIFSLLTLVSCKNGKTNEDNSTLNVNAESTEASHESHKSETSDVYSNAWINEMKLNDGAKWHANYETNEGVKQMQNSLKTAQNETLKDYHELVNQLNDSKNFIIKNCTMKGASHDNLHVWLLPLLEKIDGLSEIKTVEEALKIKQSIIDNVDAYSTYFQ